MKIPSFLFVIILRLSLIDIIAAGHDKLTCRLYPDYNYFSVWNSSSQIVTFLDYTKNISVLYDGNKGDFFAFLYEDYKAIYIPPNVSNKTWNTQRQSYEEYFKNPIPPTELIYIGKAFGYQFDSLSISSNFAQRMTEMMTHLSIDFNNQCQCLASRILVEKMNSHLFKTNLWGFKRVMRPNTAKARADFLWITGLHGGLGYFFEPFGGIKALASKRIKLDYQRINKEINSFRLLNYLLHELAPKFNLGQILKKRFNSPLEFFILMSGLSGDISYGFDGFIFISIEILKVNYNMNSRENLLRILKSYLFNPRARNNNLKQIFYSEIARFIHTCKHLKLDDDFHDLMMMLNHILEEKWIHKGVNMSIILKAIMEVKFPATENDFKKIVKLLDEAFEAKWKKDYKLSKQHNEKYFLKYFLQNKIY